MPTIRSVLSRIPGSPVKANLHFLHVGKTGGTAVRTALAHAESSRFILCLHPHGATLDRVPSGESVILFVRDPLTRFVSGFHSRQRRGQPRYHVPWTQGESEAFERFQTPDELAAALSSADPEERLAAERGMRAIQHVRDFQADWLGPDPLDPRQIKRILFAGSQERLDQDFERLKDLLGVEEALPLPKDPVAAHRNPEGLDRTLRPVSVQNLRDWYGRDFRTLERLRAAFPWLPRYDASNGTHRPA